MKFGDKSCVNNIQQEERPLATARWTKRIASEKGKTNRTAHSKGRESKEVMVKS